MQLKLSGLRTVADEDAFLVAQVPDDARDVCCQLLLGVLLDPLDAGQGAVYGATKLKLTQ